MGEALAGRPRAPPENFLVCPLASNGEKPHDRPLMGADDLKRVREHIEAMILGQPSLTPAEIKGADGELRSTLAGLQILGTQLSERTHALAQREVWFSGVVSAARVAIWECDVTAVRAMLAEDEMLTRMDGEPELVRVLAERLKVVAANQEALDMFGAASREMLDACVEELVHDEAGALFRSLFRAIARGDLHAKLEGTAYRINADELHVLVALVAPDRNAATVTLAWTDLTTRRDQLAVEQSMAQQSKERERVNKDVERLFRAVSHDLRAPLRAVQNLAGWALEDLESGNTEDVPRHLTALKGRAERLERMLTDLLSYARVGRAEHAYESVDVGELLTEVRDMVELPDGFEVRWSATMPTVVTQRTLLSQVFLNLIGNAIKHHDEDAGVIEVKAEEREGFVEFHVSDDGPGIKSEHRSKIFGLFTTLKRRDAVEGSGMGLAFTRKVVRQLGGKIGVLGEEGRGVTFAFTWPKGPTTTSRRKKKRPPTLVGFKPGEPE